MHPHWPLTTAHTVSGGHSPQQMSGPSTPPHAATVVVVVLVDVVTVVLDVLLDVVVVAHALVHASQQLEQSLVVPPSAVQRAASRAVRHFVTPFRSRQQVTKPGFPQVERAAQRLTALLHWRGSSPSPARSAATPAAHRTWAPCDGAVAHGQSVSTCARASATACASPGPSPQRACPDVGATRITMKASKPGTSVMSVLLSRAIS